MYVTMRFGTLVRLIVVVAVAAVVIFVLLTGNVREPDQEPAGDVRVSCVINCAEQVNID